MLLKTDILASDLHLHYIIIVTVYFIAYDCSFCDETSS